jgi:hypothetical protein
VCSIILAMLVYFPLPKAAERQRLQAEARAGSVASGSRQDSPAPSETQVAP